MVYVQFTIDPKGRVHEVEILPPAEAHPLLVQAAMETIRKASPLPPVPDFLKGQDRIVIILGMRFELK
jgi:TonB family protein